MLNLLKKLISDDTAQDLAEYGIALAVIGVGTAAVVLAVATDVTQLWQNASTTLSTAL